MCRRLQHDCHCSCRRAVSPTGRACRGVDSRDGHRDRRIFWRPQDRPTHGECVAAHRLPVAARRHFAHRSVRNFAGQDLARALRHRRAAGQLGSCRGTPSRSQGTRPAARSEDRAGLRPRRTAKGRRFVRAVGLQVNRQATGIRGRCSLRLGGALGRSVETMGVSRHPTVGTLSADPLRGREGESVEILCCGRCIRISFSRGIVRHGGARGGRCGVSGSVVSRGRWGCRDALGGRGHFCSVPGCRCDGDRRSYEARQRPKSSQ